MVSTGNQEYDLFGPNLLPIKLFFTDKGFPAISPLEKSTVAKIWERFLCKPPPPPPPQVQKDVSLAKSNCEVSQVTVSVEDLNLVTIFGNSLYETPEIPTEDYDNCTTACHHLAARIKIPFPCISIPCQQSRVRARSSVILLRHLVYLYFLFLSVLGAGSSFQNDWQKNKRKKEDR